MRRRVPQVSERPREDPQEDEHTGGDEEDGDAKAGVHHQFCAVDRSREEDDLLVPVATGPVPRNSEVTIGWAGSRGALQVRLEAYARRLENLRLLPLGINPAEEPMLVADALRMIGSGTARGLEASLTWAGRRGMSVVASYRWAAASRTVADVTFTPRVHRDHEGEVGASWQRGASTWSLRFSARSGQPTTPVLAILPFVDYRSPNSDARVITDRVTHLAGPYNSRVLPPHVRIDVGWRSERSVGWFGGGTLKPFVSVANLFSLPNVVGALPDQDFGATSELVYAPQLPMLPTSLVQHLRCVPRP